MKSFKYILFTQINRISIASSAKLTEYRNIFILHCYEVINITIWGVLASFNIPAAASRNVKSHAMLTARPQRSLNIYKYMPATVNKG